MAAAQAAAGRVASRLHSAFCVCVCVSGFISRYDTELTEYDYYCSSDSGGGGGGGGRVISAAAAAAAAVTPVSSSRQ